MDNLWNFIYWKFHMHQELCWVLKMPGYIDISCCDDALNTSILLPQRVLCFYHSSNCQLLPENSQVEMFSPDIYPDIQTRLSAEMLIRVTHGQVRLHRLKTCFELPLNLSCFCILLTPSSSGHSSVKPRSPVSHPPLLHSCPHNQN